ncbi:MAG: hypothetical protein J6R19_00120 [Bacteroidales bacterium]|nr:hypothetical protein [Bacteroidales bacterium]
MALFSTELRKKKNKQTLAFFAKKSEAWLIIFEMKAIIIKNITKFAAI